MSTATPTPAPEPEKVPGQLFDEHLVEIARPVVAAMFQEHGDVLRSVGVFFDYYGTLNDADIQKGLWFGPHGMVQSPDGIIGSLGSSLRLTAEILNRGFQLEAALREHLAGLLLQIKQAEEKLHGAPQGEEAQAESQAG